MEPLRRIQDFEKVKLLADARRMAILQLLMAGPWTLSQLGLALNEHPAQVRHHLKLLEDAGLVELTATHVVRGFVEKYYQARAQAFLIQELILPALVERKATIAMGSHDLALELLFEELNDQKKGMSFLALPVGSLDGLVALRQGIAHLAGSHLWDAASGEYNLPHVRSLFPDRTMVLMTLAHRRQGLVLAPGNPLRIYGLEDLARPEVTLVHRNRGSGTRVWLERALGQAGVTPQQVHAYTQEVRTHTELALTIARGRADVGLGLQAAAIAYNLDFVPLFEERYDLVLPQDQVDNQGIRMILAGLHSPAFRERVGEMVGYNPSQMGEMIVV
jgi:molybdate-binding protein